MRGTREDLSVNSSAGLRPGLGLLAGIGLLGVALGLLLPFRAEIDRVVPALVLVLPVLASGAVGGHRPAILIAIASAFVVNVLFLPPYNTLRISLRTDTIALFVFLIVAVTVGALAADLARRRLTAEHRAEEMTRMRVELEMSDSTRRQLEEETTRLRVLEQIDLQRSALLRSVSHDLRTPLSTIQAVASDLRSDTPYDGRTRNELLGIVSDEADRLNRLVTNLLSLSRIEAGAMAPDRQAVDLSELVHDRVNHLARLLDDVRLVIEMPDDLPLVDGDYTQLEQLVTNLLENAARHAPQGSAVTIRGTSETSGIVVLSVEDHGMGISIEDRERIFQPFCRGDGSKSSGIGLAICKGVAESHGGHISVHDTDGGGATFVTSLPVRCQDARV